MKSGDLMKFTIVSKGDTKSNALTDKMMNYMLGMNMVFDEESPEIVISVGGDGTLLQAFHRYQHIVSDVSFVGVHTGHLGFYADWGQDEVERLIVALKNDEFETVEYPLVEVLIHYESVGMETKYLALNEATLRMTNGSTLVMDVEIRNRHLKDSEAMAYVFPRPLVLLHTTRH